MQHRHPVERLLSRYNEGMSVRQEAIFMGEMGPRSKFVLYPEAGIMFIGRESKWTHFHSRWQYGMVLRERLSP